MRLKEAGTAGKSRMKVMLPVIMPAVLAVRKSGGSFPIPMILSHRLPLLSVRPCQAAVADGASHITMQSTLASVSVLNVMAGLVVLIPIIVAARLLRIDAFARHRPWADLAERAPLPQAGEVA
ncbi:hypothetical protein [Gemmobacter sp. 24YEA27]|uniref:hypothetical protein n=1 Tax=Gemmobacter sp. 24YEA27 TaxID=3040672 RepID=UPI0024B35C9F|nr:hypothetical protein [Gemmobacter sp. 24YEA27]